MQKHELINNVHQLEQLNSTFEIILDNIYNSLKNNCASVEQTFQLHCIICDIFDVGMPVVKEICDLYSDDWNRILEFKTNIKR